MINEPHEHHLTVPRTARYYTMGMPGPETRSVWIACHGYGHLAAEFIARLGAIATPDRLLIAPEALNRFYHDTRPGASAASAVGATWMTREDRASEIADQITYLDALYAAVFREVARDAVRVTVLGFSQGVATVSRWLAHSTVRVDRLVCWAGAIPDDVSLTNESALRRAALVMVVGSRDQYATAARVTAQEAALNAAGKSFMRFEFDGGHRLDDTVLQDLARRDAAK
jgi:predicted esterase